jgi:CheY-like chemotaxis protein
MVANARIHGPHGGFDGPTAQALVPALRVLVVEDDTDTANTMAMLLHCWGFESLAVATASAGLDVAQTGFPDVVLLDLALPGMDGFEFAKRLREQPRQESKIPFLIAVSGYGDPENCRRAHEAGIDLHLVKPVDLAALQTLLKRFHRVIMPAAERRFASSRRPIRPTPSLNSCSEQAMLKQCVRRSAEIRCLGNEISSGLSAAGNVGEKSKILDRWCLQAARFLDETAIASHLVTSFQRWGVYS